MSVIDELLQSNREYARQFDRPGLATQPPAKLRWWRAWIPGSMFLASWDSALARPM